MRIGSLHVKRRVWISAAGVVAATAAWWLWSRASSSEAARGAAPKRPFVQLADGSAGAGDRILREQAELLDPTPLFFPTKWNYGQGPLRGDVAREPLQVFGSFDPKYVYADENMKAFGLERSPLPQRPSDLLALGDEIPFGGFGQIDVPRRPLPERRGYLEVRPLGSPNIIISQRLADVEVPRRDYGPLEFLVVVSRYGLVGEPVLAAGSGSDEVDAFFSSFLVKTFRLGERLEPGRYRVLLGP
jgi:hypothetical protein